MLHGGELLGIGTEEVTRLTKGKWLHAQLGKEGMIMPPGKSDQEEVWSDPLHKRSWP